jgi:hypothetical protein
MPRLFTAIEIPRDAALCLSFLRGGLPSARWIDTENYHLTLRFIGDVDCRTADEVVAELDRVARPGFELTLRGVQEAALHLRRGCPLARARGAAGRCRQGMPAGRHRAEPTEIRTACDTCAAAPSEGRGRRALPVRARQFPLAVLPCGSLRTLLVARFRRWRPLSPGRGLHAEGIGLAPCAGAYCRSGMIGASALGRRPALPI